MAMCDAELKLMRHNRGLFGGGGVDMPLEPW
jgi:hypothetical protein